MRKTEIMTEEAPPCNAEENKNKIMAFQNRKQKDFVDTWIRIHLKTGFGSVMICSRIKLRVKLSSEFCVIR